MDHIALYPLILFDCVYLKWYSYMHVQHKVENYKEDVLYEWLFFNVS